MKAIEKQEIEALPTIGYWSAFGGVEIKRIEYGTADYVVCVANAWYGKHTYHRLKIKYTHTKNSRAYVEMEGTTFYLDECVRTNIT